MRTVPGDGESKGPELPLRTRAEQACYLGVDLGGTQLRMGAVGADGMLLGEILSVPTGRGFGPSDFAAELDRLRGRFDSALAGREVAALGVGTLGVFRQGGLSQCDNLPLLNGADIAALAGTVAGQSVAIENDARCFVLAEARFGAARGARDVVGLTLGTGVGCGVMVAGELLGGAHREAGEVWRIPLRSEPVENHVSGAGVVRAYRAAGGASVLQDAAGVALAAAEGDEAARAAWRSFGRDLGFLCQCAASFLDPECLVLGGSLAQARDLFGEALAETVRLWPTRVVYAELGAAAGVIGAAALRIP
jgi:glucokinase